jgi:predicted amidohydrolase
MKVAVVQISSVLDYNINLNKIENYLSEIVSSGVDKVFLPECYYSMSNGNDITPHYITMEADNEHFQRIINLAKKYQVYLLGGSVVCKIADQYYNRAISISPDGEILNIYDKIHLFACSFSDKSRSLDERKMYTMGKKPEVFQLEQFKIGMSICFDLRFPELYRYYQTQNCDLISISSAFTYPTGKAHWEALVRSRAIETQAFVVATNQWGEHNEKMFSYGHSLVVDPWGEVLLDLGEKESFGIVDLDISKIQKVRETMDINPQVSFDA